MSLKVEPLPPYPDLTDEERTARAEKFLDVMKTRRTVREFSSQAVPRRIIEAAIKTASLAPSGANRQPWHFAVIEDADLKCKIREAAEEEERAFYKGRAPKEWLEALAPLGTDWRKPFLEAAPALIVVFQRSWEVSADDKRLKNYYVTESTSIAAGFLLSALHHAGLATLTHTPSPMGFLRDVLQRPANEKAIMIIVTGHPAKTAHVPVIGKKPFAEVASFY